MTETDLLLFFVILGIGILIFILLKKKTTKDENVLIMLNQQLNQLHQMVDNKLSESTKAMQIQFGQSAKIIQDVTEKLAKLDDTNRQVVGFAEQLQSLENILRNPKQRGVLGEVILEQIIKNVLPSNLYQRQYEFKDGEKVDMVIFVDKNKIIPIDSKFSLENYNRILKEKDSARREELEKMFKQDLKNRIDETSKYIRPNEKTINIALMFIPSEAVYSDLAENEVGAIKSNTRDLIEYAHEKGVSIVSPNMLYAYLQTILHGLRILQVEQKAIEIRKWVEALAKHLVSYEEYFKKIGNSLGATVNSYNNAYKEFGKIDKNVMKITNGRPKIEIKEIEKPSTEE